MRLSKRNIKILLHLAAHGLIMAFIFFSVILVYLDLHFISVAVVIIVATIIYAIGFFIARSNNNKSSIKTFGRLVWITPLFWTTIWGSGIFIAKRIERYEKAEAYRSMDNYEYTFVLIQEKFPSLLPGYHHLNPTTNILTPFEFATPYGDTIFVNSCLNEDNEPTYKTTSIKLIAPAESVQDTTYLFEKTIQFLKDFTNKATLNSANNNWMKFMTPAQERPNSSEVLMTRFYINDPSTQECIGVMTIVKYDSANYSSYELLIGNEYSKLCISVKEIPVLKH